jgi:hypothetical protein
MSILPLRYEYFLSVGINTPRQMPLMTGKARALRNMGLFVTSVMPQLMSDLEKYGWKTWGSHERNLQVPSRFFDG